MFFSNSFSIIFTISLVFLSLSFLQVVRYTLPLVTLPYLVRVLGAEKFGLSVFAVGFMQFFVMLTDFGFDLSATKEISIHRKNEDRVSEIFTSDIMIGSGRRQSKFYRPLQILTFRIDYTLWGDDGRSLFRSPGESLSLAQLRTLSVTHACRH